MLENAFLPSKKTTFLLFYSVLVVALAVEM